MNERHLVFEEVVPTEEHTGILFRLLNERIYKISHSADVRYEEHQQFVVSHPYRAWFLIKNGTNYTGSFYVTNENTIGMNFSNEADENIVECIINFVRKNYEPHAPIHSVRSSCFSINVSPENNQLINSLNSLGAKLAQLSFYLPK